MPSDPPRLCGPSPRTAAGVGSGPTLAELRAASGDRVTVSSGPPGVGHRFQVRFGAAGELSGSLSGPRRPRPSPGSPPGPAAASSRSAEGVAVADVEVALVAVVGEVGAAGEPERGADLGGAQGALEAVQPPGQVAGGPVGP